MECVTFKKKIITHQPPVAHCFSDNSALFHIVELTPGLKSDFQLYFEGVHDHFLCSVSITSVSIWIFRKYTHKADSQHFNPHRHHSNNFKRYLSEILYPITTRGRTSQL